MSEAHAAEAMKRQRVLVVGLGTMGLSHARAYRAIDGFDLVGLCTRNAAGRKDLDQEFPGLPRFERLTEALQALKPDAVAIAAYTEHHAPMALEALAAGAHVFCEKPLADTLEAAENDRGRGAQGEEGAARRLYPARPSVVDALRRDRPHARQAARHAHEPQPAVLGLVLGGAQGAHAIDLADRRLRRPLRRRDVPGDASQARRSARGRRAAHRGDRADHGQLRPSPHRLRRRLGRLVRGRLGSDDQRDRLLREGHDRAERKRVDHRQEAAGEGLKSSDHEAHTKTNALRIHYAKLDAAGAFVRPDTIESTEDEPGHQDLCEREQRLFLKAIRGEADLADHWAGAVNSLRIVFAADESMRTGGVVRLR